MSDEPFTSLLKNHEDTVTYCVIDEQTNNDQWVEIGLYTWEIETAPLDGSFPSDLADEDDVTAVEQRDGVGLRIRTYSPKYDAPKELLQEIVVSAFETFSHGYSASDGLTFRIESDDVDAIRQTAREIVVAVFAYWWWLENKSAYDRYTKRRRGENKQPEIKQVTSDGCVVRSDGERVDTPYCVSSTELQVRDSVQTPVESCKETLEETVTEVNEEYDHSTVKEAYNALKSRIDAQRPEVTRTEGRKNEDALHAAAAAVEEVDGVGFTTKMHVINEFSGVDELCESIQGDTDDKVLEMTQITPERVVEMENVLRESGVWVTEHEE
jgi:hypothetical protein